MSLSHLLALSHFRKIGPVGYRNLLTIVGKVENFWHATRQHMLEAGIETPTIEAFMSWRSTTNLQQFVDDIARRKISIVTINDPDYPKLLKEINDPPYLLYYRGTLPPHDAVCVGVVGTRTPTSTGRITAFSIAKELAAAGAIVVSGLAQGIDQEAHRGATTKHARTIAVLGCGMDGVDTGYKANIVTEILQYGGAVITEYPPTTPAHPQNFPIRNRIIAGICKGTAVVEAALDSGSLITAYAALEENRDVFAVPGPLHADMSKGSNSLLRQGARAVLCAQDILDDLQTELVPPPNETPELSPAETAIYNLLNKTPQHVDDIALAAGLPTPAVAGTLATLEIQGVVRNLGGMRYIR